MTHIPYLGGGQQIAHALAGQFEVLSTNAAGPQLQYLRSGQLRALAVGSPQRLAAMPQLPTLAEQGYPQANLVSLFGLFAPAGTSAARVQRLNEAVNAVLKTAELRRLMAQGNILPGGGSVAALAEAIAQARSRNLAVFGRK